MKIDLNGFAVILLVISCIGLALVSGRAEENPCPIRSTLVVVKVEEKRLVLCKSGMSDGSFSISLGRGGVGKRSYRDLKTPLGHYSLGVPRSSERFHTFIPIGYPTPEQASQGYTGQDIGIHGPSPKFKWAGRLNTWFGWTAGCIATGTDPEIDEIAAWIRRARAREIVIE